MNLEQKRTLSDFGSNSTIIKKKACGRHTARSIREPHLHCTFNYILLVLFVEVFCSHPSRRVICTIKVWYKISHFKSFYSLQSNISRRHRSINKLDQLCKITSCCCVLPTSLLKQHNTLYTLATNKMHLRHHDNTLARCSTICEYPRSVSCKLSLAIIQLSPSFGVKTLESDGNRVILA